ncbi:MAG: lipid-A-disaccharide synthase [Holophagae bacterium]|jgi:lipid-A-disaccharide synthase
MSATLMIVAGEVSGDIHAGNLLAALRTMAPGLSAFGVGGDRLAANGLSCIATTDQLAHMGLIEVLRELPRIRGVMHRLVAEARSRRPALAVLVDSPDFNLRLAARLRRIGVPVVLYVSPQLWAWRRGRVRVVRRLAREVLCLLPFEVDFYREHGVRARYVGHPLVDDVAADGPPCVPLDAVPGRLALLPGSRGMEVQHLLPTMLRALKSLDGDSVTDAVLIEAPGVGKAIDRVLAGEAVDPRLRRVVGRARRSELASAPLAWTASGTATLECALLDVPMIIGYRLQPLSYAVAKHLVRIDHVGLVNLIAGRRLAPELIQHDWSPDRLAETTRLVLADGLETQRSGLVRVRDSLGPPGASRRAAEAIIEHL